MVAVVQLVEHQVVILAVAGSSPVSHPDTGNAVCASRRRFWFQALTRLNSVVEAIPVDAGRATR